MLLFFEQSEQYVFAIFITLIHEYVKEVYN